VLYPFPLSRRWLADELPLIVGMTFSGSLGCSCGCNRAAFALRAGRTGTGKRRQSRPLQ
jgi:hypothetical protein